MKKGFTLIEVVMTTALIAVLASFMLMSISKYNSIKNDIDLLMCKNMVISMINDGKQYCRDRKASGYVMFDIEKNEIRFYCGGRRIDKFKFPDAIKIYSINTEFSRININKFGIAGDAGTITIRDKNNDLHEITVNVGVGYAEIK